MLSVLGVCEKIIKPLIMHSQEEKSFKSAGDVTNLRIKLDKLGIM